MEATTSWLDQLLDSLVVHEGCVPWFYCDRIGLVTVGIGNLVKTEDAAARLLMLHAIGGAEATESEKRRAWRSVKASFRENAPARYYRRFSGLRMPADYARRLCKLRVEGEFLPACQKLFHGFDEWPDPAKIGTLDMIYSLGLGGLSKFVNFIAACQARNWSAAARRCQRRGGTDRRNDWTRDLFEDAAAEARRVS